MQNTPSLPHHKLIVFGVACEMLVAIRDARIRDTKLRDEALRAAKGVCCNCAEGAGRVTRAYQARAFTVARGGCVRTPAPTVITAPLRGCSPRTAPPFAGLARSDRI